MKCSSFDCQCVSLSSCSDVYLQCFILLLQQLYKGMLRERWKAKQKRNAIALHSCDKFVALNGCTAASSSRATSRSVVCVQW